MALTRLFVHDTFYDATDNFTYTPGMRLTLDNTTQSARITRLQNSGVVSTDETIDPAGVAITGGNIDGTVIGATTAAAGTFTTVYTGNGTAGAPSIAFSTDPATGFYRNTTNQLSVVAGGATVATLSSAGLAVADGMKFLGRGTVGQIPFAFDFDTDTGLGRTGADAVAFYCGGTAILDIDNALVSVNGVPFQADYGTLAAPGLSFVGDGNTGFYRPANGEIGVSVNGVERARFAPAGLGIGTTNPDEALHVVGTVIADEANVGTQNYTGVNFLQVTGSSTSGLLIHNSSTTGTGYITFGDGAVAGRIAYSHAGEYMNFTTGAAGSERMRLDATGLGIENTSPSYALHIGDGTDTTVQLALQSTDAGATIINMGDASNAAAGKITYSNSTNTFTFVRAGSVDMTLDATGLGIGTTNPQEALHVNGGVRIAGLLQFDGNFRNLSQVSSTALGMGFLGGTSSSNGASLAVYGGTHATLAGNMYLTTGGAASVGDLVVRNSNGAGFTEYMRIKHTTGRVGINESSPDYLLDVNGTFGFTPGTSVTPVDNGDVVFEATNNTTFTVKLKGTDGTVRSGTVTLA